MNDPVLDRVRQIAADVFQLPIDSISTRSSADTTKGWDSLGHVNLVVALEESFGIQFTPEEMEQMLSIELIGLVIDEKLAS